MFMLCVEQGRIDSNFSKMSSLIVHGLTLSHHLISYSFCPSDSPPGIINDSTFLFFRLTAFKFHDPSSFAYIHPQTQTLQFFLQSININIFTLRRCPGSFHPEQNQILSLNRQLFVSQSQLFHQFSRFLD